jgi:DNA-binding SARP family transcriptional activator/LysM repeat protein
MTRPAPKHDIVRRAGALLVLTAAVLGTPSALLALGAPYLPSAFPTWQQVVIALSQPDTGGLLLGLLVVVGWCAWAIFCLSVALEMTAQVRGTRVVVLPGLRSTQQLAGFLVAAVIGTSTMPLLAAPAGAASIVVADVPLLAQNGHSAWTGKSTVPAASDPTYTVQPRDTLGRIAGRYLGDWTRYEEIFELNRDRPQPDGGVLVDPGVIRPGWVLVLPRDASNTPTRPISEVTVLPGDTLEEIAAEHGMSDWRPIFELNAGEPLPGGGVFTDPNLIRPGQVLDLPPIAQPTIPVPDAPAPTGAPQPPSPSTGDAPEPDPPPTTPPTSSPTGSPADDGHAPPGSAVEAADEEPSSLAIVLAGSGALLAAGVYAAWRSRRRDRLRRRRVGRRLTPPPADVAVTQDVVTSAASVSRYDYAALDRALRELSVLTSNDPEGRLPDVVAAQLSSGLLRLRLFARDEHVPPAPWSTDETGEWWSLELDADTGVDANVARGRLAPYPSLVTIGDDADGRWLLDLERIGALPVAGDAELRQRFIRHVAAELAVNSWSDLLTVSTVGFGEELTDLAPDRLRPVTKEDDAQLRSTLKQAAAHRKRGEVLSGRLRATAGDGWMPHVVLMPDETSLGDELRALYEALNGGGERGSTALVYGSRADDEGDWTVGLAEGELTLPALKLRIRPAELSYDDGRDIAALVAFERDAGDEAIPPALGERPWQRHTDEAGALVDDAETLLNSRPAEEGAPSTSQAAASSPMPRPMQGVPAQASPQLQREVAVDLEQLDRDVADWWSPDCPRPRLRLLGPVELRAHGDEQAVARSGLRRRYEEAVAYLATRPHGATVDEAATALQAVRTKNSDPVSARAYVHRVTAGARAWLGTDPVSGEKYLSAGHRGRYVLSGVLVDADLFRQLRARAAVRGAPSGLSDLLSALELVAGPPFDQRPTGYEWLNGLDHSLSAAICDVAHQVVTAALSEGPLEAAQRASAAAVLVAPEDEAVLLDAVSVAYAAGRRAEAERFVSLLIELHDGEDEMDLPLSTAEAIKRARHCHDNQASGRG